MEYSCYHYAHIGHYSCPSCGHRRHAADFSVTALDLKAGTFTINGETDISLAFKSIYNVYNILAAWSVCSLAGADREALPLEEDALLLETDGPDRALDKKETARIINQALSRLDKPQRELFVRHYYYGQTVREAALAMGLNLSTAKTWLRRGRETLKTMLKKEGYGNEAAEDFQANG